VADRRGRTLGANWHFGNVETKRSTNAVLSTANTLKYLLTAAAAVELS